MADTKISALTDGGQAAAGDEFVVSRTGGLSRKIDVEKLPPAFPGGLPLTGLSYPRAKGDNLSTGDNDLYTCPAGKRALVLGIQIQNQSAGSIVWYPTVKISAAYYRLLVNLTVTTGSVGNSFNIGYILEAGEGLSINTATNNNANVAARIIEFDNTCALYSSKITSFSAGDNTVYTCPVGKTAILIAQNFEYTSQSTTLCYVNSSGGSRTRYWHFVTSGGSPGTTNQCSPSASVTDGNRSNSDGNITMNAGDFININVDANTATQMAWVNVMEI